MSDTKDLGYPFPVTIERSAQTGWWKLRAYNENLLAGASRTRVGARFRAWRIARRMRRGAKWIIR